MPEVETDMPEVEIESSIHEKQNDTRKNLDRESRKPKTVEETDNNKPDGSPNKDDKSVIGTYQIKEENTEQNKENIDMRPKIRLVSLDKLMAIPTKKTVTFDTSIIILTSSDEECTPKKPNESVDQNGTLKSALKKSPITLTKRNDIELKKSSMTTTKKNDVEVISINEKNDSEEDDVPLSRQSRRVKQKENEKQQQRIRLKSIFTRTKSNEWKGKSCDSDSEDEKPNKKRKSAQGTGCNGNKNRKKLNKVPKPSVDKFTLKVYVPLPRVECDKLQEICSVQANVFSANR